MTDIHYKVILTEDFTRKGQSDQNDFGIIFSDQTPSALNDLSTLDYYKKVNIPYNQASGRIERQINESRDDHIIGFYNQFSNATNYTTSNILEYAYHENNETLAHNETELIIDNLRTKNISINEAGFDLQKGYMNHTSVYDNMSFYPPPSLIWEDLHYNKLWYEFWVVNSSYIGHVFNKLYIPFRYVPPSNGRVYVQVYNATTTISLRTLYPLDFYNPAYSVINVLSSPFLYQGGVITIKVWTNEFINWWLPIQVATQSPRSTNSSMQKVDIFLGIPFTTNYPNKCFFKGWLCEQNLSMPILSETYMTEQQIVFNLTFPLGDYGVSVFNIINFSLNIHDLSHNLTLFNQVDANVMFYNFNNSCFYNFASGILENKSYSLYYSDLSPYINDRNQILSQIVLRGKNQTFFMQLNNLSFNMWYQDIKVLTAYYINYTIDITGLLYSNIKAISQYIETPYGYTYTESFSQHISMNRTLTLMTATNVISVNETLEIDEIINRESIYYLHTPGNEGFDIYWNYYQPLILVDIYRDQEDWIEIGDYGVNVYFFE